MNPKTETPTTHPVSEDDGDSLRRLRASQHPGPGELHAHLLTRSELAALLEHVLYRADGQTRTTLRQIMPDAYSRLVFGRPA